MFLEDMLLHQVADDRVWKPLVNGGAVVDRRDKINETLSVELTSDGQHVRIVREGGGLVIVHVSELGALIATLSELEDQYYTDLGDAVDIDLEGGDNE